MFAQERLRAITEILHTEKKVLVKNLSKKFNISEDAIRKDLKLLENQGILKRTYGGGILEKQTPAFEKVAERNAHNYDKKEQIAEKAFSMLQNKETILLDISSTNLILAQKIVQSDLSLTVISNSIDILHALSKDEKTTLISLGGMYFQLAGGFVGSETIDSVQKYNVQKTFLGSCGVDLKTKSLTTFNVEDGNTKRAFMESGRDVYLVMESKKFHYDGIYKFASVDQLTGIILDEKPSDAIEKQLAKL
ncbi:MAG TPA: DeoR/GlpR transcriptional regulator, partial [Eubacteriaceae bacterium]|nr:DeoR/GlpR transcriptional regulator [Eubacteriaceae bacterium]